MMQTNSRPRARTGAHPRWLTLWLLVGVMLFAACRNRGADDVLEPDAVAARIAALNRHLDRHPDDDEAWRELGVLHWSYRADFETARPIFEGLSERGDPVGQYAMAVASHGRLDLDGLWTHGGALVQRALAGEDELAIRLAEPAIRLLEDVHGDVHGDDKRWIAMYESAQFDRLPVEFARILTSVRARIERTRGGDYLAIYDREGCVRNWLPGEMEGHLGPLELRERDADRTGFAADPEGVVTPLACAVRVWNPAPDPGIRRLRTVLDVPGQRLDLHVGAQEPVRVYLDGVRIYQTDSTERWPAKRVLLELAVKPGEHVLEVRTSIPDERAWVLVRATDERGGPVPAKAAPSANGPGYAAEDDTARNRVAMWPEVPRKHALAGSSYAPLRSFLALDDALTDGDSDRAETGAGALERYADNFAEAQLLLADFEEADPTRGRNASGAREQKALEAALFLDPSLDRARLELLMAKLDRGDGAEVLESLNALDPDQLDGLYGQLLRYRTFANRGSEALADAALARASEIHPDQCEVLSAKRNMASEREESSIEDELTKRLEACPGTLGVRARLAMRRARYDDARKLWEEALARVPDDVDALASLANLAVVERRWDDAIAHNRRILELAPYRDSSRIAIADILASQGKREAAQAEVAASLEHIPHSNALRRIAGTLGMDDDLLQWRVDGQAFLAEYRKLDDPYAGAPEVLVLDRDVTRVYENGGARHLVHQITELRTKEAIDNNGEFVAPPGARLLTLHSVKPDGTVVEPESIAGKDGLSLRDLEIGDAIEVEYVMSADPAAMLPGYADLGRFRFQSLVTPFHHSELIVAFPSGWEANLLIEARNDAPVAQKGEKGELKTLRFLAKQMPGRTPEPGTRSLLDELPMIRVHSRLHFEDWLRTLAVRLGNGRRTNPELRRLVQDLTAEAANAEDRLRVLWTWVVENVEDAGDLSIPATRTLAARQGNRLVLLHAMLEAAGVDSQLWLARDGFGPTDVGEEHRNVELYADPMLAVDVGASEPVMVIASSEVLPLGFLAPGYVGAEAVRVPLNAGEKPELVRLPGAPKDLPNQRRYDLTLALNAEGNGTLKGVIELQGVEALQWRSALEEIDRDRLEEVFQSAELGQLLPAASLDLGKFEIENEKALRSPLRLEFEAAVRGAGIVQNGELVLPAAVVGMNLGLPYTRLPERWSGMVIPYAPRREAKVRIVLEGRSFTDVGSDVAMNTDHGTHGWKVVEGAAGDQEILIESHGTLRTGIVEVERYGALSGFTKDVAAAEQRVLRAR